MFLPQIFTTAVNNILMLISRNKSQFFEDPQVDPLFRATLDAYKNSGYDRGHMVCVGGYGV